MTSLEMILFPIAFMFSPIFISGGWVGGTAYISQNQNVTLTCIQLFDSWGGYIGNFFEFSNFFKLFDTNVAQHLPQLQIWPKKWLRLGQNSQIKSFCRIFYVFHHLFPQNEAEIDSELSILPDSQLLPSFATKVSHFWRNPKNFHFWGKGTLAKFLSRLH